jgi:hypothetical protein
MTGWFRLWFVYSSFAPLYLIFAVKLRFTEGVPRVSWILAGLAFLGSIPVFALVARSLRRRDGVPFEVTDVRAKDSEIFSYLTSYIPPLIARDMADPSIYIPLAILYAVIFGAFMRLDSPYLNPFFVVLGYRLYEARLLPSRAVVTVITRGGRLAGSEELLLREVGAGDLYFCDRRAPA